MFAFYCVELALFQISTNLSTQFPVLMCRCFHIPLQWYSTYDSYCIGALDDSAFPHSLLSCAQQPEVIKPLLTQNITLKSSIRDLQFQSIVEYASVDVHLVFFS